MQGKDTKGMVMLLLFLVATLANAVPKSGDRNVNFVASAFSTSSSVCTSYSSEINPVTGLYNPHLEAIAAEFHKPPVSFVVSPPQANRIKFLPSVPGTLPMVLLGFLCVSLVKDRRFWLGTLAGLLWAGHAGFNVLPQLASHLVNKKRCEQQFSPDCTRLSEPKHSCRMRSDIEGASYVGLLRHLAGIPDTAVSFLPCISVRSNLEREYKKIIAKSCYLYEYSNTSERSLFYTKLFALFHERLHKRSDHFDRTTQLAIKGLSTCLIRAACCLALRAEQLVYFSPAFITTNLARGPPDIIRIVNLLYLKG